MPFRVVKPTTKATEEEYAPYFGAPVRYESPTSSPVNGTASNLPAVSSMRLKPESADLGLSPDRDIWLVAFTGRVEWTGPGRHPDPLQEPDFNYLAVVLRELDMKPNNRVRTVHVPNIDVAVEEVPLKAGGDLAESSDRGLASLVDAGCRRRPDLSFVPSAQLTGAEIESLDCGHSKSKLLPAWTGADMYSPTRV